MGWSTLQCHPDSRALRHHPSHPQREQTRQGQKGSRNNVGPPPHQTGNGDGEKGKERGKTRRQLPPSTGTATPVSEAFLRAQWRAPLPAALTVERTPACGMPGAATLWCPRAREAPDTVIHAGRSHFQCGDVETGFLNKVLIKHNLIFI